MKISVFQKTLSGLTQEIFIHVFLRKIDVIFSGQIETRDNYDLGTFCKQKILAFCLLVLI